MTNPPAGTPNAKDHTHVWDDGVCQMCGHVANTVPAPPAGTPTMTAEDARFCETLIVMEEGFYARILATYHALAASQQKVTRLRGLLDMTYSREDQDRLAAIFASPPPETTQGEQNA